MKTYKYSVRELRWSLEYRLVTAKTFEDAQAKIAENKYHSDSEHEDTEYEEDFYEAGEDIQTTVGGWDELQDETIYPIVVLHQDIIFTLNNIGDISAGRGRLDWLRDDLRKHVCGESTNYTYLSPEALNKVIGS